jgi:thiol:disulfide interchange protein DsbC
MRALIATVLLAIASIACAGEATVREMIAGQILDVRTGRNLTEERLRKLSAIHWDSLPFVSAITTVRGSGRRKIAVFSDPNCPYCQRFEKILAGIDDITVHIFLYPVIKPESVALTKAIWCSRDRAGAWHALLLRGVRPTAAPDCDTPVDTLVALGRRLGATSTPTWFLQNGERYSGAMGAEKLIKLLDESSR